MRITGEHVLTADPEQVWRGLQDPQVLADAIPGLQALELRGPDEYGLIVKVGVGSVRAMYAGTFTLADKREGESCAVRVAAGGGAGSVEVQARMTLAAHDGGGARLRYEADATITGALAGVGQRMLGAAAKKTTREFLEALDRRLASPPAAAAASDAAAPTDAATPTDAAGSAADGAAPAAAAQGGAPVVLQPARVSLARRDEELVRIGGATLAGFLLAIVGILVGRRTAVRR
ncbi:MAG TPA: carbon monoxide dehydrogenase subunit G [Conexibacter sp.]|nr:carbon monoxide dehydrogenase subunit G [Conexibacter sp.]